MKRLSLVTAIITLLMTNAAFANSTIHGTGGAITLTGYIYEPQCEINIANQYQINIQCYRAGQYHSINSALKKGDQIKSKYIKVEYNPQSRLPTLNIYYN